MNLQQLRLKIDEIDEELIRLFLRRLSLSAEVAKFKYKSNIPIHDSNREQQKLNDIVLSIPCEYRDYITELYTQIFKISRTEQQRIINEQSKT